MMFRFDIEPMGAVRMTQRGKFVKGNASRYLQYKNAIATMALQSSQEPTLAACGVKIRFIMPIPKSWSKKKQLAAIGQPHISKPDIDNLIKGCFDAVNGLIWKDDNQVVDVQAVKVYGEQPGIEMEVFELF